MNPLSCLSRDTGSIKNTGKTLVGFADEFGNGKICKAASQWDGRQLQNFWEAQPWFAQQAREGGKLRHFGQGTGVSSRSDKDA